MTQDEIIEMARQAGIDHHKLWNDDGTNNLEAFAKLVRNHYSYTHAHLWLTRIEGAVKAEREACAEICKKHADVYGAFEPTPSFQAAWAACIDLRDQIRARGDV